MKKIFLFIAALCASALMMADGINDYTKTADLSYVDDSKVYHKLDVYYPADDGKTTHPVIIHIYGSAWTGNNMKGSADLKTVGLAALQAGYILVTPNHRASTDAIFPAQIQDLKAVVRYLRGNAETLGIDTSFIAVSGFSSGGHLAALMGVTSNITDTNAAYIEGNEGNFTLESSAVDAVCTWSGIVEIRNIDGCDPVGAIDQVQPFTENLIGSSYESNPMKWALASANNYVNTGDAPTIIFHGSNDQLVPQCVSVNFYDNLRAAGVDCEYYLHAGGHEVHAGSLDKMITFFNRIRSSQSQALEDLSIPSSAHKFLRDGQLLIEKNGKTFNAQGMEI